MRQFEQQMTVSGNSPHTLTFPEAASAAFEKGAPVDLAAGAVSEAATPVTALVGVAAMPSTGITGSKITVWIANDDTLFAAECPGAVQADIGLARAVKKTGALWNVDRATAGNFLIMEIGVALPGAVPIVRGKFLESVTKLSKIA